MYNTLLSLCTLLVIFCSASFAAEGHGTDCTSCHSLSVQDASELLKNTGGMVKSVKPAPVKGLFELLVEKDGRTGIIYVDYAKKILMQGFAIDLATLKPLMAHSQELAAEQPKQATSVDVTSLPLDNAIVIGNPKGARKLYVFTDPDCPYCREFHSELKTLAASSSDIAIYIIPFPLPMHPGAYDKARAILEAKSQDVLNKAFEGKDVPRPVKDESKAQVDTNIKYGNSKEITGTPTFILPNGAIVVGGRDADTLKKMLEEAK
ncbi:MAG: DsbC family protein [Oryzomonas sp.]|uniref:DsbC family protein n=1 Tax=Oryzomonas sp. TaxID=2855186 RepID=UPI00284E0B70|nr:DsbC family protein [Oryzomonas sp.]MDR3580924.1 DsbC family protein [Oryzomonas sp.]